ncbi:uncharacterized protein LOC126379239 [Pectinophora gossypiella]|uniref:uncharacterized protein LOC126379239 n=1 Tax=Pectinophora gossypiella TaxID=13191 RepID=UPI00214F1110|nr:uncharacterized protein LOC126379239 [Pectinophora gossypiella]XP_049883890.1 uncharacterized protein LOC126379239 [Pectinophora gossypiella]
MESVSVSTELLYSHRGHSDRFKSDYNVDFWREVRRRWLVFGVLLSVTAAVLAPAAGAPGGVLHSEYLRYVPLTYIYYCSGRHCRRAGGACGGGGGGARLLLLCVLHAHVIAPALTVLAARAAGGGADHTLVRGAVLCMSGGCGWVSLALRPAPPAPALCAALYLASLLAGPATTLLICGRATIPPLGGILSTVLISTTPFLLGSLRQQEPNNNTTTTKLSALLLLYMDCCERLREAEGSMYVGDVLVTLALVVWWVCSSALCCWAYGRCGAVPAARAALLAVCAVPSCPDTGWISSAACSPRGLSRLPAVFIAPAQALLLAAVVDDGDER